MGYNLNELKEKFLPTQKVKSVTRNELEARLSPHGPHRRLLKTFHLKDHFEDITAAANLSRLTIQNSIIEGDLELAMLGKYDRSNLSIELKNTIVTGEIKGEIEEILSISIVDSYVNQFRPQINTMTNLIIEGSRIKTFTFSSVEINEVIISRSKFDSFTGTSWSGGVRMFLNKMAVLNFWVMSSGHYKSASVLIAAGSRLPMFNFSKFENATKFTIQNCTGKLNLDSCVFTDQLSIHGGSSGNRHINTTLSLKKTQLLGVSDLSNIFCHQLLLSENYITKTLIVFEENFRAHDREFYRFLKHQARQKNDHVNFLRYKSAELRQLRKENDSIPPGDWFVLWFNYFTNRHGLSPYRAAKVLLSTIVLSFVIYSSILLYQGKLVWNVSGEGFSNMLYAILKFANPIPLTRKIFAWGFTEDQLNSWANSVLIVSKILIGIMIYQFVTAFRKFGKN